MYLSQKCDMNYWSIRKRKVSRDQVKEEFKKYFFLFLHANIMIVEAVLKSTHNIQFCGRMLRNHPYLFYLSLVLLTRDFVPP